MLWTIACQAPLSTGFSRQEYWIGLSSPSPGDLPDPGIEPVSLFLKKKYLFLIDWWLLYNTGLISVIHGHALTSGGHASPPLEAPSHLQPIATPLGYYRARVWVPGHAAVSHWLAVYMWQCMSPCHPLHSPHPLLFPPPLSLSLFSMSASPEPVSLVSPALAGGLFTTSTTWKI